MSDGISKETQEWANEAKRQAIQAVGLLEQALALIRQAQDVYYCVFDDCAAELIKEINTVKEYIKEYDDPNYLKEFDDKPPEAGA